MTFEECIVELKEAIGKSLVILQDAFRKLNDMPTVEPERLTDDDFETIRIHLSAYKEKLSNQHRWKEAEEYQKIIDRFMSFASAESQKNLIGSRAERRTNEN